MELSVPRERMLVEGHLWERVTKEYRLTLECQHEVLVIALDTQSAGFRRVLGGGQGSEFKEHFRCVKDIFDSIRDPTRCEVQHQAGVLAFTLPLPAGRSQKKRLVEMPLARLPKVSPSDRAEHMLSKIVKRMHRAEKELRGDTVELRRQLKELREQLRDNSSREERERAILRVEVSRLREEAQERESSYRRAEEQMKESIAEVREEIKEMQGRAKEDLEAVREEVEEASGRGNRLEEWAVETQQRLAEEVEKMAGQQAAVDQQVDKLKGFLEHVSEKVVAMELKHLFCSRPDSEVEELQSKHSPYLIGITTHNFELDSNRITLRNEARDCGRVYVQQLLVNVAVKWVFAFRVRVVSSRAGLLSVGVVDTQQRQELHSVISGNAISYFGAEGGILNYGEDGQCKQKLTGDEFCEGMEIKVMLQGLRVSFTLTPPLGKPRTHSITSDILGQSHREFVPFIQMTHAGDCVEWAIL